MLDPAAIRFRPALAQCLPASQGGYCLVGETDACALARALCRGAHPLDIVGYSSVGLWLGFLVLCAGLIVDG
jgi:hypothetical protein